MLEIVYTQRFKKKIRPREHFNLVVTQVHSDKYCYFLIFLSHFFFENSNTPEVLNVINGVY